MRVGQTQRAHDLSAAEAVRRESAEEAQALRAELEAKEARLAGYRETELALRREKSALEEKQKEMALEIQRRVDAERQRIEQTTGYEVPQFGAGVDIVIEEHGE